MGEAAELAVGDDVIAVAGAHGTIADIREMSNGETVYGVADVNGVVRFYLASGLKKVLDV